MKLQEYLESTNTSQSTFAKRMRVRQQTVSDWCAGLPPKRKNALKIKKITKDAVTLKDLWGVEVA